jgi:hypothetical protein
MKKFVFFLFSILFCFIIGCDPIDDESNKGFYILKNGATKTISCTTERFTDIDGSGTLITCGTSVTKIYDGEDGRCTTCSQTITVLAAPCSTRFVVLKIITSSSTLFVASEPVHEGNNIYGKMATLLNVSTGYKYESISTVGIADYCFFKINTTGTVLETWDGVE